MTAQKLDGVATAAAIKTELTTRVAALRERGVVFVDRGAAQASDRGALTQAYLGGVTIELVASDPRP